MSNLEDVQRVAFLDELEKIAVSKDRMQVPQARAGRRPLSVDTLLKKEKDGTLYKHTGDQSKIAGAVPPPGPNPAKGNKKKWELVSKEEGDHDLASGLGAVLYDVVTR